MSRRQKSGGQAIVMVTLALIAMAGMMGLAVDFGWSFYVQKEAQAAADTAALAAAQQALPIIPSPVASFTCSPSAPADLCFGSESCVSPGSNSILKSACVYAEQYGFDPSKITIKQGDSSNPPTGINRIAYWTTVRVSQTIPQLFSAVLSSPSSPTTQGTVSAAATAGVVGAITPISLTAMNHAGDADGTGSIGLDLTTAGAGGGCPDGGGPAEICALGGIVLASSCPIGACTGNAVSLGNQGVETKSVTMVNGARPTDGFLNISSILQPQSLANNSPVFNDPTAPNAQPPVQTQKPIAACGVTDDQLMSADQPLGPYQYFHISNDQPDGKPDGKPIQLDGTISFLNTSTYCPGTLYSTGAVTQPNSSFRTYVFYGGLNVNANANVTLDAGQYIMAGVKANVNVNTPVFNMAADASISASPAAVNTGAMFVFTDGQYPPLVASGSLSASILPDNVKSIVQNLVQGNVNVTAGSITMNGLISSCLDGSCSSNLPSQMSAYAGIAWWQDRRNATVYYNEASGTQNCSACTGDDGSVIYCSSDCASSAPSSTGNGCSGSIINCNNHVSTDSASVKMNIGDSARLHLKGVIYQPRGSHLDITPSTIAADSNLQLIGGSLSVNGTGSLVLSSGRANPLITYKAALIRVDACRQTASGVVCEP